MVGMIALLLLGVCILLLELAFYRRLRENPGRALKIHLPIVITVGVLLQFGGIPYAVGALIGAIEITTTFSKRNQAEESLLSQYGRLNRRFERARRSGNPNVIIVREQRRKVREELKARGIEMPR